MLDTLKKTDRGSDFDGRAAFSACDHSVFLASLQRGRHSRANPVKGGRLATAEAYSGLKTTIASGGIWKVIDAGRP